MAECCCFIENVHFAWLRPAHPILYSCSGKGKEKGPVGCSHCGILPSKLKQTSLVLELLPYCLPRCFERSAADSSAVPLSVLRVVFCVALHKEQLRVFSRKNERKYS